MVKDAMTIELGEQQTRERDPLTPEDKDRTARILATVLGAELQGQGLKVDQARALGAKDSAHDVFFLQTPQKTKHGGVAFACKRFRRLESAEHELDSIAQAQQRGFQTMDPVRDGIYPIEDIGHVLVTRHVPRFTTMNYLGWRNTYVGLSDYKRRMATPLQRIGRFAAGMHSSGILHGDFQLKNIAQDHLGEFILFDMEDAVFAEPEEVGTTDFVSYVGQDVSVLVSSLVDRGFLWSSTDKLFEQEVTENLFDPYLESTTLTDPYLLELMHRSVEDALLERARLHPNFSSRIGLPS